MSDDPRKATSIVIRESLIEIKSDVKSILAKVDDHHVTIYGKNGLPGLDKQVDRLVQAETSRKAWRATLGTATIGLVANAIWDKMRGHS